jgi:hypothetical protein
MEYILYSIVNTVDCERVNINVRYITKDQILQTGSDKDFRKERIDATTSVAIADVFLNRIWNHNNG